MMAALIAWVEAIEADIAEVDARIEQHLAPFRSAGGPAA